MAETFRRHEKKYILTKAQHDELEQLISTHMKRDKFCETKPYLIRNVYLDTLNNDMVRISCDKPVYKEKLRVRKYGEYNDGLNDYYLEIKRKYAGVVYKRRVKLTKEELHSFTLKGIIPSNKTPLETQILKEMKYLFKIYNPVPKSFISYERPAYYDIDDSEFRLTFDENLFSRRDDFSFDNMEKETVLLPEGYYLMEVKVGSGMPLWFANALSKINAKPGSFSKYGTDFKELTRKGDSYASSSIWYNT